MNYLKALLALSSLVTLTAPSFAYSNPDPANDCELPIKRIIDPKVNYFFDKQDLINELRFVKSELTVSEKIRRRFIVVNMNTLDKIGRCKGVKEQHPSLKSIAEFELLTEAMLFKSIPTLKTLTETSFSSLVSGQGYNRLERKRLRREYEKAKIFYETVWKYKSPEINKGQTNNGYCVGQTLSVCEMDSYGTIHQVAKFITATKQAGVIQAMADYNMPKNSYYSPINVISGRSWDERYYGIMEKERDAVFGGSNGARIAMFRNRVAMPNFMSFRPEKGYYGMIGNGVHEKTNAVGNALKDQMGSPVSLGCLRVEDFASKFIRWYIPVGAKLFTHYYVDRYAAFPIDKDARKQVVRHEIQRKNNHWLVDGYERKITKELIEWKKAQAPLVKHKDSATAY